MEYIHGKDICHGDLKPCNVLVFENNGDWIYKISDFGEARSAIQNTCISTSTLTTSKARGTAAYLPPESFVNYASPVCKAKDTYAMAITCYQMFHPSLEHPWQNDVNAFEYHFVREKVLAGERPTVSNDSIPDWFLSLIKSCWHQDPEQRPSMEYVIELMKVACTEGEYMFAL